MPNGVTCAAARPTFAASPCSRRSPGSATFASAARLTGAAGSLIRTAEVWPLPDPAFFGRIAGHALQCTARAHRWLGVRVRSCQSNKLSIDLGHDRDIARLLRRRARLNQAVPAVDSGPACHHWLALHGAGVVRELSQTSRGRSLSPCDIPGRYGSTRSTRSGRADREAPIRSAYLRRLTRLAARSYRRSDAGRSNWEDLLSPDALPVGEPSGAGFDPPPTALGARAFAPRGAQARSLCRPQRCGFIAGRRLRGTAPKRASLRGDRRYRSPSPSSLEAAPIRTARQR